MAGAPAFQMPTQTESPYKALAPWRQEDRQIPLPQGQGAMLNPAPGTIEGLPLPAQEPDQAMLQRQALLQQLGRPAL